MREALLQHVSHVEARQGGHERVVELARLLDSLEFMPKNYAPSENPWLIGDMLHEFLVQSIKLYKGRMDFVDDVMTMLTAAQAYEVFRERQSSTSRTTAA